MKKQSVFNEGNAKGLSKKWFYVAMALSLIAVIIAVYIGVSGTLNSLNKDDSDGALSSLDSSSDDIGNNVADVDNSKSDVPKEDDKSEVEVSDDKTDVPKEQSKPYTTQASTQSQPEKQTSAKPQLFMMPVEGEIINPYSKGELVKSKTLNEWRTHDGIDIKSPADTPVKAICDGTIDDIEEDPMWGIKVTIAHENDYTSYYCGLKSNVPVKIGQTVKIGDMIGYVGNTAEIEIAEESHLHIGVKKGDDWVDPQEVLGK